MTPEQRKLKSEQKLQAKGIAFLPSLPMIESSSDVTLKDLDTICKRVIAALLSTQVAYAIDQQELDDIQFYIDLMKSFGVRDALNKTERKLLDNIFTQQDVINVVWEYECCAALFWALGLVDHIEDADSICDCEQSIHFVADYQTYEEFKTKCQLRNIEEILDMLDLYYRYHWAVVERQYNNPQLPIGNLNPEVVFERRRGLEWLISEESDWHDISLDT